ncbi:hypothetical protein H2C83_06085 [Thermoactinomyces sp. AMNI-1]|uniref:Uncharacterized protein n=1 Tax=Thermoactinomyces mirandus TaxID=2756294 RepID=A0A7W1XRD0_9BACL|nr:hypothetical protein [Thermoactinomyces mirandus]
MAVMLVFSFSVQVASAKMFARGFADIASTYDSEVFHAKKGTIVFAEKMRLTDQEYIDVRVELCTADGEVIQTRIGNVYNFHSSAESPFTVPENGEYYFHLVNETPDSHWWLNYKVHDHYKPI